MIKLRKRSGDRLELIFTRAAPDFWSIRSSTVRVLIGPLPLSSLDKTDIAGEWQRYVPKFMNALGDTHRALGELEQARPTYDKALALWRRLLEQHPDDMQLLNGLLVSLDRTGDMFMIGGDYARAAAAYEESIHIMSELLSSSSRTQRSSLDLALLMNKLGKVYCAQDKWGAGESAFRAAVELLSTQDEIPEAVRLCAAVQAGLDNATSQKNKYPFTPTIHEGSGPKESSVLFDFGTLLRLAQEVSTTEDPFK